MIENLVRFFRHTIWEVDLRGVRGPRFWLLATLRVAAHALRQIVSDLGGIRAAGLTLHTLLAVVPFLALVFAVAKGLGYDDDLDRALLQLRAEMPEHMRVFVDQVRGLVDRTDFRALGALGTLLLGYSAFKLFTGVETSFNRTWRVRGRPWMRRIVEFAGLVVLVPVLVVFAVTLQSVLHGARWFEDVSWADWLYRKGVGAGPYVAIWLAFTALYRLMPAARVKFVPAALAGALAGAGWMALHGVYVDAQIGVARVNQIYAAFAALPLFLIYVQMTWTVILVGAEVSAAIQNLHRLRTEDLPAPPFVVRERLALHLGGRAVAAFVRGERGCAPADLAVDLDVPVDWLEDVADDLAAEDVLGWVKGRERLVPLLPPERLDALAVAEALRGRAPDAVLRRLALPDELERRVQRVEETRRRELAGWCWRGEDAPDAAG